MRSAAQRTELFWLMGAHEARGYLVPRFPRARRPSIDLRDVGFVEHAKHPMVA